MSEVHKPHSERFDLDYEREHLDWLKTLKASDMDGISAQNLVLRYARLFEQYEALQAAARKFLATGNEIDLADLTTPGEYLYDLIPHRWPDDYEDNAPYPAKRPL